MGIADLIKMSGSLPDLAGQMQGPMNAISDAFTQMVIGLKTLVNLQAPATVLETFNEGTNPVDADGISIGPTTFVARWVDVEVLAASASPITIQFYDQNFQQRLGQAGIRLVAGTFRSYSVASKGIFISGQNANYTVTFWR